MIEEKVRQSVMVRPTNSKSFEKIMRKKSIENKSAFNSNKKQQKKTKMRY